MYDFYNFADVLIMSILHNVYSTIYRGVRPFGVSLLIAGWDEERGGTNSLTVSGGPVLFQADPSVKIMLEFYPI